MSRATYVYIITDAEGKPLCGFTVKYRAVEWAKDQKQEGLKLLRVRNGGSRYGRNVEGRWETIKEVFVEIPFDK